MKIIQTGGRGTTRRVAEKEEDNWAGPGFIEYSKQQRSDLATLQIQQKNLQLKALGLVLEEEPVKEK